MTRVDECIYTLGEAQYFTSLEAYSGYWEMKILNNTDTKKHLFAMRELSNEFVCLSG